MSIMFSNGGKYDRRWYTLNIGCKPRNGGMFILKALCVAHIGANEAYGEAQ